MEEKMTLQEVLELTVRELREISVPIDLIDTIGMKVKDAVHNISVCINVMAEAQAAQAQEAPGEEEQDGRETDAGERDGDTGAPA